MSPEPSRTVCGSVPGVDFYGPVGVVSGLGSAARGYVLALRAAAIPTAVIPVHELFVHQASIGEIERHQPPRHSVSLVHINADSVHRFMHFHASRFSRARYRIGIWVWELPALKDEWCSELRYFDEIWVPSTFCQRAVQAVTAKPVVVMPHIVNPDAPRQSVRNKLPLANDEFVILYVFDASSDVERKNPQCLVEAFEAEFGPHERVRLVLKVSRPDRTFREYLDALIARNPRCIVLTETLEPNEVSGLIAGCDCYASPHRAEGFGLTVAEAMALGMPVIATDYGGTADFVTPDTGFPLRYRLAELQRNHGPYAKGAIWSDPSRKHLQELLRFVSANRAAAAATGQRARAHMQRHYSAAVVGRSIRTRLAEIASSRQLP
jgi:glycosyltransferase involved in cell wall biosynthesis